MTTTTPHDTSIVAALLEKGVRIPNPGSLEVAADVDPRRISGDNVTIHAGCRIRGAKTVIGAGSTLGAEGPVTVENCQLGRDVELKGGFFAKAVFLDRANMGLAAHVREGSLLEEESGGAHCVGLKQTILFPFVTLGSLINFCDCLMSGGTSRADHSEVGSSYIHFNFTPDGNKTTASLFGDVPRGVMLDQPAIFLGGQGGAVGPVRTGYGTVVAAGSVLRGDVNDDGMLVVPRPAPGITRPVAKHSYRQLPRLLERNLTYIASLDALEAWYRGVRGDFFAAWPLGELVHEGALAAIASGRSERVKRLKALIGNLADSDSGRHELHEQLDALVGVFGRPDVVVPKTLTAELAAARQAGHDYLAAIKALSAQTRQDGIDWLQGLIDERTARAAALVPSLGLFTRN